MSHEALLENLVKRVSLLELKVEKLEKATSLFHETPRVPDGWCQICGMEKKSCVHAEPV